MRYAVFIDSNAIIGNGYKINSTAIKAFFKENQLVIARPTFDEVTKKYINHQEEHEKTLMNHVKSAEKFGIKVNLEIKEKVDIESRLSSELNALNCKLLSIENIDIEAIYRKSLYLEKPFKEKKSKEAGGFRDALIWDLWMYFLEEESYKFEEIIIINQDSDFVSGNKLQSDLVDDLQQRKISLEKVTIFPNMKAFNELVMDELNIQKEPEDEEEFLEFIPKIIDHATDFGLEVSILEQVNNVISDDHEPEIDFIRRKDDTRLEYFSHEDGTQYAYFVENFEINVSYFIHKSDYYTELLINREIIDDDWNDWVMRVQESFTVEVGFEVKVDVLNDKIFECNFYASDQLIPEKHGSYHEQKNYS
ncbi:hypothetical protein OPHB3_3937 [Oceanobacillus picturae]|uniref:DUF4935 domain-containing protein n=1 Tax=Oceanobacillus picturae TaxID=171693 RepID=A0A0U9HBN3_9BACI|nr:DUF4935 domain-containing protein [Oceanobacillus picturae]GAQ19951.1 hypothetical protein OPHB3_3937 [Oceanobacillus picturae]